MADIAQGMVQTTRSIEMTPLATPTVISLSHDISTTAAPKPSSSTTMPPPAPKLSVTRIVKATPTSTNTPTPPLSSSAPQYTYVTPIPAAASTTGTTSEKRKAPAEESKTEPEVSSKKPRKPAATIKRKAHPILTLTSTSNLPLSCSKSSPNAIHITDMHLHPPSRKTTSTSTSSGHGKVPPPLFPAAYGPVPTFDRITFYAKKSAQGVDGILFANLNERAVVCYLNPLDPLLSRQLQVGDVVLSVNAIDARYVKFKAVVNMIMAPGVVASEGPAQVLEGAPVVLLRNKTNDDKMVCIVFARPGNMAEILPKIEDLLVTPAIEIPKGDGGSGEGKDDVSDYENIHSAPHALQGIKTSQKTKTQQIKKVKPKTPRGSNDDDEEEE
ncbi:hypothetical protein EON65_13200 [archaeon]|nr:MAG: hypothetical protein EON65_13200 [archaeon]